MAACEGVTKSGQPCGAPALRGGRFCFMHDPDVAAERKAARRRGGRRRHGRDIGTTGAGADADAIQLDTAGDVLALVRRAVVDVLQLENSIARARAVATLANTALQALQVADLAERLTALEEALEEVKKER